MKVLFLSNTAGQGHHSTAAALMQMLTERGAQCRMLDTFAYCNPVLYKTVSRGYLLSTSVMPYAYGKFYRLAETKDKNESKHSVTNLANTLLAHKLRNYLKNEFTPDVVVCTHVFSAQVIDAMKKHGYTDVKTIGIITDYCIHPFWEDVESVEYIVTASELLTNQALKRGIAKERIVPLGIPIHPKFSKAVGQQQAREELGIDPDRFTVLLMSGSMGYGNMTQVLQSIDQLDKDFQVLAVCGNNRRAKAEIEQLQTRKKVYPFGYVHNVELMMDAANCIITKPGGLTSSEALAKSLPIIMVNPIPGQEERNVEFMLNNGLAVNVTKTYPIDDALYQLFYYPEKLEYMESNIRLVGKPNATSDLCDFVLGLGEKQGQ